MKRSISFIHAADLHMDAPFKGMSTLPTQIFNAAKQSTYRAFDRLIHTAIQKEVDFVLIVGDIFDQDNQSLHAQIYVRDGFLKLLDYDIQVYLSYGNHDYLSGNKYPITYPSNVHIFPSEDVTSFTFKKAEVPLAEIYGFSYERRAVTENKVPQYERKQNSTPYHIATLHGSLSTNNEHDPYAPFTIDEMKTKQYDYWALGHIHKRSQLSLHPPIIYPGNMQGRHRKESGEKGCYYCVMEEGETNMQFVSLQSILFQTATVDISDAETATDIEEILDTVAEDSSYPMFLYVIFHSTNENALQLEREGVLQDLITLWNEQHSILSDWQYIYDYDVHFNETFAQDQFFLQDLQRTLHDINVEETVELLRKDQQIRKFTEKTTDENIKEEAEKLLHYYFKFT